MNNTASIYLIADLIEAHLICTRHDNQGGRWTAMFEGWQVRENDTIVSGEFGDGSSVEAAIVDYCRKIEGRNIETTSKVNRRSFKMPAKLTIE